MSLESIKKFKQNTGLDLWGLIISFMVAYEDGKALSIIERMKKLYGTCDFEIASHAFHALIDDKSIPLEEIQDGMFRVGWMPTERDGDMSEPWPFVMASLAYELNNQFSEIVANTKKKAGTSESKTEN